jgi:hypothetical protein
MLEIQMQAFPLPGQYLFRFKTQFNKTHGKTPTRWALLHPYKRHILWECT